MPDLDTCRMPRDTLLGLIHSSSKAERITAPMPLVTLTELLGDDAPVVESPPPQFGVRFTPPPSTIHIERSHWVLAISISAAVLIGCALLFLA